MQSPARWTGRERFDHMQQHTGQHILSQAFIVTCDAETVAFHLGAASSTIDLHRNDLDAEALARVEDAANAIVDAALGVQPTFVAPELAGLPLRKPPKVTEHIRIVEVAGFDWSACGGTHVANTAQVGLIKITATERRGAELARLVPVRRPRARRLRPPADVGPGVGGAFHHRSGRVDRGGRAPGGRDAGVAQNLAELEVPWIESTAEALWSGASPRGALGVSPARSMSPSSACQVVQTLRTLPGARGPARRRRERPQIIFARADDVALDAGAVAPNRGRGRRRPRRRST